MRSRSASVTATVMLSPVSVASSRASRWASSFLMFILIFLPHLGRNSTTSSLLGKPARQAENRRTAGGCRRDEAHDELSRNLSPVAGEAGGILGRGGRGDRVGDALGPRARRVAAAVLPLVRGWAPQHLLECARPACRRRPWRAARPGLGQPGHGPDRAFHLLRPARPHCALRRV